ncbi:unnamed protein product [Amoebophrya sp. A120]|nr:unnamed protein product [Amoebophrya sp. A120]|eukprot:GSA120T00018829001.1
MATWSVYNNILEANSRSCFPTALLRPKVVGRCRTSYRLGSWCQHFSSTRHVGLRYSRTARSLIQWKSFCRAVLRHGTHLKNYRLRGSGTRSSRNANRRELPLPRPPPTKATSIEGLGRNSADHEQREWLQIGAYPTSEKRSMAVGATATGAQKEELRFPTEQQFRQMQQKMAILETEMQQKISTLETETQKKIAMLEANATACANSVTDVRHAGGTVEELTGLLMVHTFGIWRMDYVAAVVCLLSGFAAALIVVALPIRLVFFPREYCPEEESAGGEDVTAGPQQEATALAGGEQADPLSADRLNPPSAKREKYWLLPWDFAEQGTLSSVCQRGDSTEGKIFIAGLVIAEICALLSRYTLIVYDHNCSGYDTVLETKLDVISTEHMIDLALRVVWLIVPSVLMIITAAVPSNSFRANAPNAAPTTTAGDSAGSGRSTVRTRVSAIHEEDTRIWSQALHTTVLAAVGLRLIFETRQVVRERVDISGALFGVSDPLDEQALHEWRTHGD